MKRFYSQAAMTLLASLLLLACDNKKKDYPTDYVGFEHSTQTYYYNPANQVQSCKDHPHDGGTDGRAAGDAGQLLFGFRLQFHKGKPPVKFTDAN